MYITRRVYHEEERGECLLRECYCVRWTIGRPKVILFKERNPFFFFFFFFANGIYLWYSEKVSLYWIKKERGKKEKKRKGKKDWWVEKGSKGVVHARAREWRTRRLKPIGRSPRLSPKGRTKRLINHSGMSFCYTNLFLYLCGVVSDSDESI